MWTRRCGSKSIALRRWRRYVPWTRVRRPLRFSKSGDRNVEKVLQHAGGSGSTVVHRVDALTSDACAPRLSLDDDVLLAVKERARRENRTAGEVLSDLARQALTQQQNADPRTGRSESFYGFEPFEHRGPAVSNALVDRLRDEEAV